MMRKFWLLFVFLGLIHGVGMAKGRDEDAYRYYTEENGEQNESVVRGELLEDLEVFRSSGWMRRRLYTFFRYAMEDTELECFHPELKEYLLEIEKLNSIVLATKRLEEPWTGHLGHPDVIERLKAHSRSFVYQNGSKTYSYKATFLKVGDFEHDLALDIHYEEQGKKKHAQIHFPAFINNDGRALFGGMTLLGHLSPNFVGDIPELFHHFYLENMGDNNLDKLRRLQVEGESPFELLRGSFLLKNGVLYAYEYYWLLDIVDRRLREKYPMSLSMKEWLIELGQQEVHLQLSLAKSALGLTRFSKLIQEARNGAKLDNSNVYLRRDNENPALWRFFFGNKNASKTEGVGILVEAPGDQVTKVHAVQVLGRYSYAYQVLRDLGIIGLSKIP